MKRAVFLLSSVAITGLLGTNASALKCEGNACADIKVNFDGHCYHAVNSGSKKAKVDFTPYGGIATSVSKVVGPGEDWKPQVYGGACLSGFVDPYHANYAVNANASTSSGEMNLFSALRPKKRYEACVDAHIMELPITPV